MEGAFSPSLVLQANAIQWAKKSHRSERQPHQAVTLTSTRPALRVVPLLVDESATENQVEILSTTNLETDVTSSKTPPRRMGEKPVKPKQKRRHGRKNIMDAEVRKAILEQDKWTGEVTATWVECLGCENPIVLDRRREFYTYGWDKHKKTCGGIPLEDKPIEPEETGRPKRGTKRSEACASDLVEEPEGGMSATPESLDAGDSMMDSQSTTASPEYSGQQSSHAEDTGRYASPLRPWLCGPGVPPVPQNVAFDCERTSSNRYLEFNCTDIQTKSYWMEAPFAPNPPPSPVPAGPTSYRYSMRYELMSGFIGKLHG
ncbi:hypothetical protein Hypma_014251 [Hypsizygus marmoreus]|uniref:Uncharacterized protein n=1 Tax=Hypsizygus marmoreus TaxID=39966 RepID=A0A369JAH3_HYPMA|nr:hypothetical protein Hypma_014251 [Hypsizygus marmoreus]